MKKGEILLRWMNKRGKKESGASLKLLRVSERRRWRQFLAYFEAFLVLTDMREGAREDEKANQ